LHHFSFIFFLPFIRFLFIFDRHGFLLPRHQRDARWSFNGLYHRYDRLCGLVVRLPGCRPRGLWFNSPALPDFLSSSGSGTGSTQSL
jgi:hypothetical protein